MTVVSVDGSLDLSLDLGDRLGVDLADLSPATLAAVRAILQELVRLWREDLIELWPVDTGRSQASWETRWEGLVWVIRNPVEYAEYVHNAGDGTEVWTFLEARSEELVADATPEIEGLITAQKRVDRKAGGRTRSLLGFAARALAARSSARTFAAQAAAFRVVSSRERTRRQLKRFAA